jgi:hypothetical protein
MERKMSENKTHYRKVFKSDHLGVADLEEYLEEGKKLVFTVTHVKQYFYDPSDRKTGIVVAGKRIGANIAFFKESIKPLVLNATNSKTMKGFNNNSPYVEEWANTMIQLYIDPNVKMKGDVVGGVRISPTRPSTAKPQLTPESDNWQVAIDYFASASDMEKLKGYDINKKDTLLLVAEIQKLKEVANDKS